MAVPPPRTCSGNWTPSNRSLGTFIGPIRNSPRISTRDWNSWLVIWSSPAFNGRFGLEVFLRIHQLALSFRTVLAFQKNIQQGILLNPTAYVLPTEICAMVNVVLDAKNQSFKLCSVDGVDVVRKLWSVSPMWKLWSVSPMWKDALSEIIHYLSTVGYLLSIFLCLLNEEGPTYPNVANTRFRIKRMRMKRKRKRLYFQ